MARWEKGGRTVRYLVDKGRLESIEAEDLGASLGEHGRHTEGPRQNLSQAGVVRAGGVGANEAGVAYFPGGHQPGPFGPFDLPMNRRMRSTRPLRDLGEAQFELWIPQQQREDLALLLGAQDRQERRRRLSIHNLKDTLQFAEDL